MNCPECRREVSDKAAVCPGCGHPLSPQGRPHFGVGYPYWGYEYKSKARLLGMPLIHIAQGLSPEGRFRVAKGFIAIGNVAVGVIAMGGAAIGVLSFAGAGIGIVCFAGLAAGVLCGIGGVAVGYIAIGGIAIGMYAIGGLCLGPHTIYNDPRMMKFLEKLFRP
jgi:hypothetical protein